MTIKYLGIAGEQEEVRLLAWKNHEKSAGEIEDSPHVSVTAYHLLDFFSLMIKEQFFPPRP